ncbi:FliM/FliN family flagellar motor switch protein [Synechococcales cyanobacterium CNB]|nr:FliM/FliN family flagellar motor switch protein [Synechococcales cyanobacterium CNB]
MRGVRAHGLRPRGSRDCAGPPMSAAMKEADLRTILTLEVPVIVRLGERQLPMRDVLALVPGAIIELDKRADHELELLVNNRVIGSGTAVKVGENFGLRVSRVGLALDRLDAALNPATGDGSTDEAEEPSAQAA